MNDDTGRRLAQRFIGALRSVEREGHGAVEAMALLFDDTATLTNPALEQTGNVRRGRDGARTFWNSYADAFAGATTEFSHVTLGDGGIGLFWTTTGGSAPAGGPPLRYAGATLIEHDEAGAIIRFRGYYDTESLKVSAGESRSSTQPA